MFNRGAQKKTWWSSKRKEVRCSNFTIADVDVYNIKTPADCNFNVAIGTIEFSEEQTDEIKKL